MHSIRRAHQTARAWLALALIVTLVLALLAGLALTVVSTLSSQAGPTDGPQEQQSTASASSRPASPAASTQDPGDELAAQPMLQLAPSAARPQPLVVEIAGPPIPLPRASENTSLVPTGFPRTPEGALAQLAAIDALAFRDLSPAQLRRVHAWATAPGAVPVEQWTPFVAASAALEAAGAPEGDAELTSTFTPVAGQIKGSVGDDFTVVCVLGEWQVTYRDTSRAGAGDCQRMQWSDGRWWIGAGDQPAYAPSAWPGSADAVRAGWRALSDA